MKISIYQAGNGKSPYLDWLNGLKDAEGVASIRNTLRKLQSGNTAPLKRLKGQDDLWEIRVMSKGPGYRLYCIIEDQELIILLGGGSKKTQADDIRKAGRAANDYRKS